MPRRKTFCATSKSLPQPSGSPSFAPTSRTWCSGNLQEIMNRVLAAQRNSQAQLVEARMKSEVQRIEAQTRVGAQEREAEANAHAQKLAAEAATEAKRTQTQAEVTTLKERATD